MNSTSSQTCDQVYRYRVSAQWTENHAASAWPPRTSRHVGDLLVKCPGLPVTDHGSRAHISTSKGSKHLSSRCSSSSQHSKCSRRRSHSPCTLPWPSLDRHPRPQHMGGLASAAPLSPRLQKRRPCACQSRHLNLPDPLVGMRRRRPRLRRPRTGTTDPSPSSKAGRSPLAGTGEATA